MGNHLFDLIRSRMPAPDAPFALLDDGRRFSYGDMVAVSARFAAALTGLGVKPGDRVAVQVEKSFEALMLYLGTVRAGAIFLPLNTAYTPAEIEYFLGDAEPAVFVCDPSKAEALRPYAEKAGAKLETLGIGNGSLLDKANVASGDFTDVARGPDDLAAILYTSGTTGRSKGAMLTHDNLASNSLSLVDYWRFTDKDVRADIQLYAALATTIGFAMSGVIAGAFRRIGIGGFASAGLMSVLFALVCGWLAFLPWFAPITAWLLFGFLGACPIQYMTVMVAAFPTHYAGRVTTSSNLVVFSVIFAGQWAIGRVVDLWPRTATGYAPDGYTWAFGALFILQLAGLLWLALSRAHPMARPRLAVAG